LVKVTSRLTRNTTALLVSNVGSAGLSFLLSVLIGRALGKDGLGVYSTALAWIAPLSLAADFGLGTLITRDVAQDAAAASEYLHSTTWVRLWLGGGLTLAVVLLAPFLSRDPAVQRGVQISAPLIIIMPFFGAFTAVFRARQVMAPIAWLNLGMLVAQVALTLLVFLLGGDVIMALIVNTATSAGQLAAAWWVWRRWFYDDHAVGTWRAMSLPLMPLLRRAMPFAVAAVLAALQARVGTILLERLTDTGSVGYYTAATRFVEAGRTIPNALFGALFPALAALAADPPQLEGLFRRVMLGLSGFGIAAGIICTGLALPILALTYGKDFLPASVVLQVAIWSLLPSVLRGARTLYWYARQREGWVNVITVVMLVLQIGFSLALIPPYGALGVALVSLMVEGIGLVLIWRPLR
jgi:O-antigen/teichoic acid export membrane protein